MFGACALRQRVQTLDFDAERDVQGCRDFSATICRVVSILVSVCCSSSEMPCDTGTVGVGQAFLLVHQRRQQAAFFLFILTLLQAVQERRHVDQLDAAANAGDGVAQLPDAVERVSECRSQMDNLHADGIHYSTLYKCRQF